MKRIMKSISKYTTASAMLLSVLSCSRTADEASGFGSICIAGRSTTEVSVKNGTSQQEATVEIPDLALPDEGAFAVSITDKEGTEQTWASLTEFGEGNRYFAEGDYTVRLSAGDIEDEGFDKPFFTGESTVHVTARTQATATVTTHIGNSLAIIECTDNFSGYFTTASFTLTTAAGYSEEMTMPMDKPLFIRPQPFSITCKATKQTGEEIALPVQIFRDIAPRTRYTIRFDVADAGAGTVRIELDDTLVEEVEIDAELNDNALPDEKQ
ncbi:MAG: DUF4493 domain-containing protein [Alistipes sp.]|nr:DUF4493 domain-containing protein [Alistipes sp.]